MVSPKQASGGDKVVGLRRDELLLKLLKTPPQPRPKRERPKTKRTTKKR